MQNCPKCKKPMSDMELWAGYTKCANCTSLDLQCEICGLNFTETGYELDGILVCPKCFEEDYGSDNSYD